MESCTCKTAMSFAHPCPRKLSLGCAVHERQKVVVICSAWRIRHIVEGEVTKKPRSADQRMNVSGPVRAHSRYARRVRRWMCKHHVTQETQTSRDHLHPCALLVPLGPLPLLASCSSATSSSLFYFHLALPQSQGCCQLLPMELHTRCSQRASGFKLHGSSTCHTAHRWACS